ncbi:unnamed protein product [Echinostoma caproni]|uniref:Ribosome biogenesis protein NOP53 n=1 Tax=Echinostoma caproni TaxID=27848 RepID=A0A183ARS7_9TREM|nr:unnamed protein product [Echinostoma caproni]
MKKLGKNKKKQWKRCYTDLETKLDVARKQRQISKGGFLLGKVEKKKRPIIKGDKNAAKAFPEIPSFSDGQPRMKKYTLHGPVRTNVDLWANAPNTTATTTTTTKVEKSEIILPTPGQSYNPTLEDHFTMLSALAKTELQKRRQEAKIDRFLQGLGTNRATADPIEDAKSFIQNLSANSQSQTATLPDQEAETVATPRKTKKVNVEKRMAVELENIPKLLKEIKRENQSRILRKKALKARKEHKKQLQKLEQDIPFQLPNELVPALRKLTPLLVPITRTLRVGPLRVTSSQAKGSFAFGTR